MKQQLDDDGKVSVQVNFAVDKADILPDSKPQIEQIVALLKQDPALQLSVDGHTDHTGDVDHNLALSKARAAAVVDAIVDRKSKRMNSRHKCASRMPYSPYTKKVEQ